ncbi:ATP-dependent DNA helicase DinG, partial [Xanthomonas citri pv. citri]
QSQLVERDIPAFLKATGLDATVALAKGRTRYLCTRNAAELEGDTSQNAMFEDEQALYDRPLSPVDADLAKRLAKAYAARTWNGDL